MDIFQSLEWLAARNIRPTREGADLAALNGHLQVLEWLAARNILPTQLGANFAAVEWTSSNLRMVGCKEHTSYTCRS